MNYTDLEKRMEELNQRVIKLEKIENRRKKILYAKILIYVILIILMIVLGFKVYAYFNKNIIEPVNNIKNSEVINDLRKLFNNWGKIWINLKD